jgi:hypothetical protein
MNARCHPIGSFTTALRRAVALLAVVALVGGYKVAVADEAGVSVWLPGTFGSLAAVPVLPGFQWSTTYYHAAATSQSRTEFEEGGRIVRGLSPKPNLIQLSPSYAFETPVLGAQLGLAVTTVPAFVSNSVTSTLAGPRGRTLSGKDSQSVQGFGDLYPRASLKWNEDVNNFMIYGTGDIPVGLYSKDNIANIGTGHGAIDSGGGYTYLHRQSGNEFSAVVGLTYNFINPTTHYQSGVDSTWTGVCRIGYPSRFLPELSDMFISKSGATAGPVIPLAVSGRVYSGWGHSLGFAFLSVRWKHR